MCPSCWGKYKRLTSLAYGKEDFPFSLAVSALSFGAKRAEYLFAKARKFHVITMCSTELTHKS